MRSCVSLCILVCLLAASANAGGLDIGAEETAFDACSTPLPSREDYLKTVIGPDGDAIYDMQTKYHAWLCETGAPLFVAGQPLVSDAPPPVRVAEIGDDDKLHFVFPGDVLGSTSTGIAPVPLPGSGFLLGFGMIGLGLIRRRTKTPL